MVIRFLHTIILKHALPILMLLRMPQVLENGRVQNPLSFTAPKTAGVIHEVVKFVDGGQYLFFALVSRGWRDAWGKRTATTSYVNSHTIV